jgi:hypothetical protein
MSDVRIGTLNDAAIPAVAARPPGAVRTGAIAGLAGGGAMALFLVGAARWEGVPALHALRVVGDAFAGADPLVGLVVHAATSAALGILLAWILPRDFPPACCAGVGAGFALLVLGLMAELFVPMVHPAFVRDMHVVGGAWVAAHAVYGVVLGLVLARRAPRVVRQVAPRG